MSNSGYNLDENDVWAAWGKTCLSAGSWGEAREKFSHCLFSQPVKPIKNPPLLDEICRILESPSSFIKIKGSQMPSDKDNATAQEVLCILSTLKPISQKKSINLSSSSFKQSIHYREEIFYLTSYGSHRSLLLFYVRHNEIKKALSYLLDHQLEPNFFLDNIMLPAYRLNLHEKFKSNLLSLDSSLESFKKYLSYSCVSLQKMKFLHTLYDLQILMQDYIRAAVTCIHLYQEKATSFTDLSTRCNFLHAALKNLEEELTIQNRKKNNKRLDIVMKMNQKNINCHIKTIWRQLESVKFLSNCEKNDKFTVNDIFPNEITNENEIPTLFDGKREKIVLVKMIIFLGKNISEGFGIGFKIVQDNQLDFKSICIQLCEKLAEDMRGDDIKELIDCVKNTGIVNINVIIDEMISFAIPKLIENDVELFKIEPFFNIIKNLDLRFAEGFPNIFQLWKMIE
ncbi:zinc finger protein FYVE domain containing protein, putative [Pediculus humanus corporis]|uniref:Zinc finger protein FYVE domain containing protein, putative n=1 Tax=Pediculus humanus subsp. corporis TaxID=121224 RepID=E0VSH8_PEDHC|nr:zinc finger protein FYVE domain containing protein, putative [Pediculus humanus corporis]EEB16334.1 zinc finger protein FYVE domain containing protein, putative [Pediculus humanus corporis]